MYLHYNKGNPLVDFVTSISIKKIKFLQIFQNKCLMQYVNHKVNKLLIVSCGDNINNINKEIYHVGCYYIYQLVGVNIGTSKNPTELNKNFA